MNKEEILSMAKQENDSQQCDEREKKVFDKSFYWAFVTVRASTLVFTLIQVAHSIEAYDKMSIVTYGAVAALTYRLIKNRRVKDVLLLICAVIGAVGTTVAFVKSL